MDAVGILKISLLSPQCPFFIGEIIVGDTKKNIFNLMILLTNKCIFYKSRESMGLFISELKKSISLFNLMEKKANDTKMMLDKFTIR